MTLQNQSQSRICRTFGYIYFYIQALSKFEDDWISFRKVMTASILLIFNNKFFSSVEPTGFDRIGIGWARKMKF